jgi:hypothetical protein
MGLDEDVVNLFENHDADLVPHRLDEAGEAQVAGAAQESLAGTGDEGQGIRAKGAVAQAGAVELGQPPLSLLPACG